MDITWLGHSSIRIRGTQVTIVTDPYDDSVGMQFPKTPADIVSISHDHPHHSYIEGVEGSPRILRGPGDYEIANFYITAMGTPRHPRRPDESDEDGEPNTELDDKQINTVYTFRGEDVSICHLGDLGRELTSRQSESLNQTDVVIAPVGGNCTLGPDKIAQLVNVIGPRIVIPVHYQINGINLELETVDKFLSEIGVSESEVSTQSRLSVTSSNLPREMSVVLLQPVS